METRAVGHVLEILRGFCRPTNVELHMIRSAEPRGCDTCEPCKNCVAYCRRSSASQRARAVWLNVKLDDVFDDEVKPTHAAEEVEGTREELPMHGLGCTHFDEQRRLIGTQTIMGKNKLRLVKLLVACCGATTSCTDYHP